MIGMPGGCYWQLVYWQQQVKKMNDRIFIVAGSYEEYKNWVSDNIDRYYAKNQSISKSNFVWVRDIDSLRGHREVHGFYIGTYKSRPDLKAIQEAIFIINHKT